MREGLGDAVEYWEGFFVDFYFFEESGELDAVLAYVVFAPVSLDGDFHFYFFGEGFLFGGRGAAAEFAHFFSVEEGFVSLAVDGW